MININQVYSYSIKEGISGERVGMIIKISFTEIADFEIRDTP
jgi:primosomal protein N'